ncbi:hypothetical protein IIU_06977 [Bacillus cereus VD133]|uniref:Uncharacterized protein n=1 Tax=Bacillus cereus VD133 TaxID=1053233 RepID=A0A9W5PJ80_BACCE|nr:hypothetical protein [Bacillus cereus]EOO23570.1 hypothetical protein IIU_06977 [Bacillus cereus VD133]
MLNIQVEEEIADVLENLDIEIEVMESKINEMKKELKGLKINRDKIKKPIELAKKISKYEKMYPEGAERNLKSLVKIDESFEEWHTRFGRYTKGGSKDIDWSKQQYENFGYTSNYIKWLIESDDQRIGGTEIYKQAKGEKIG